MRTPRPKPPVALPPIPPGATVAQLALGERVFHGQAGGGTCEGCHRSNTKGTPLAPDLTRGKWLWGDGSLAAICTNHRGRSAEPKGLQEPDASHGWRPTSESDLGAVAAYVWALSHQNVR